MSLIVHIYGSYYTFIGEGRGEGCKRDDDDDKMELLIKIFTNRDPLGPLVDTRVHARYTRDI